jgi:ATP-dependent helicase/nuclease subunit A
MWRLVCDTWRAYDEAKRRLGTLDNDDLQSECVRLLSEFADVRRRYQRRFRYLMVDEFQDTNPLQMRLIELLYVKEDAPGARLDESAVNPQKAHLLPPRRNYQFVVGDVQQSIYGFRGAEPNLFRDLETRYRRDGAGSHVPLSTNFRSRAEILQLVATLYRQIWRSDEAPFVPLNPGSEFDAPAAPCIEFLLTQDLVRQDYLAIEPSALAARIKQLVESEELRICAAHDSRRGRPARYRDIAILLRQLTDIQRYEEALARAGVPCYVVGGGRGYYARREIRDLINILTVLDTPFDDIAMLAVLRSPLIGVDVDTIYHIVDCSRGKNQTNVCNRAGEEAPTNRRKQPIPLHVAVQRAVESGVLSHEESAKLRTFADVMDPLREQLDRMPVGHLLERLIAQTLYDVRLLVRTNGKRRLANVRKLVQMAHAEPALGVREFIRRLRDLEKLSDREGDAPTEEEAADVVRIHTMHGAKGLEFPVVILADLCRSQEYAERGLFVCDPDSQALGTRICGAPDAAYLAISHARRQREREEAERLLYVAMTRAREHIILCGNLGRNRGRNWGDLLFPALGIIEAPSRPVTQTLIGGLQARVAPLAHYIQTSIVDGPKSAAHAVESVGPDYVDRLVEALLNGEPLESVEQ